ncbi:hypothetical protein Tco_1283542 [Tanacetum coccineum]
MQKNVLKHQFENFSTASNESLDKAYDRFQKLISQLEVHGAPISKEDINQKQVPNEVSTPVEILGPVLLEELVKFHLLHIDGDDLEELDLRWQVAMLTIRVKKFGRNQRRRSYGDNGRSNAPTNESSSQALVALDGLGGYDWSNDFEIDKSRLLNTSTGKMDTDLKSSRWFGGKGNYLEHRSKDSSSFMLNKVKAIPEIFVTGSCSGGYSPKNNDVQATEDVADKEEQHQMKESEKDLQDELEKMVTQELAAKAMDDVSRQALEEEKRRIASQKKATQATE